MAIHWNSPWKPSTSNKYTHFFRGMHRTFANMDGYLLRQPHFYCNSSMFFVKKVSKVRFRQRISLSLKELILVTSYIQNEGEDCFEIRRNMDFKYRAHPFYAPFIADEEGTFDVTLVSHLSLDRLHLLQPLLYSWQGNQSKRWPISVQTVLLSCIFAIHGHRTN